MGDAEDFVHRNQAGEDCHLEYCNLYQQETGDDLSHQKRDLDSQEDVGRGHATYPCGVEVLSRKVDYGSPNQIGDQKNVDDGKGQGGRNEGIDHDFEISLQWVVHPKEEDKGRHPGKDDGGNFRGTSHDVAEGGPQGSYCAADDNS